jgi:hypothetical protein
MAVSLSALLGGRALSPEIYSGTHFCYMLNKPQGLMWLEGLGKFGANLMVKMLHHEILCINTVCGVQVGT